MIADWLDQAAVCAFVAVVGFAVGRAWERERARMVAREASGTEELERILSLPDDDAALAMYQRLLAVSGSQADLHARLRLMDEVHTVVGESPGPLRQAPEEKFRVLQTRQP